MASQIPSFSLVIWTRTFAATLVRLYPSTEPADALSIAHGRYFVDEGLEPSRAAELYALSEGSPTQRSGQISQNRFTFRNLTGRFMDAPSGRAAFVQLAKDATDLFELDPVNGAIYTGVKSISTRYVRRFDANLMTPEDARLAKEKILRACFRLVVALTSDLDLRVRTLREILAEFNDLPD